MTTHPPDNIDFIIVKASERIGTDGEYSENVDRCASVPIRGAYHYFRTGYDPIAQADYFWHLVKDDGFHFLAIDYEGYNNTLDRAGAEALKEFWDHLLSLADIPIMLYTTEYILRDNLLIWNEFWRTVLFWVARYANVEDPLFLDLGIDWVIWQYGQIDGIDANVYNGTVEEMKNWLDIGGSNMNKKWYASKTLWFSILFALVNLAGAFGYAEFVPGDEVVNYVNIGISVIMALLRVFTDRGVKLITQLVKIGILIYLLM